MPRLRVPGLYTLSRWLSPPREATHQLARSDPPVTSGSPRWRCLNLGCGLDYIPSTEQREWINADVARSVKADAYFDAFAGPFPFPDEHFDLVKAYDFLEHIPHTIFDTDGRPRSGDGFFLVLDEIWRILRPGGLLEARFPATGHPNNFIDPTHTRQLARETFTWYLEPTGPYSFYTERRWQVVAYDDAQADNHFVRLRKPARTA